jgi:glycine/D-amino acid oxidase-like deaminating enzyme
LNEYDVIVVGAGIVGAACACDCARNGLRVAIIESKTVGGGATAAGMGHIVAMDDSPAQLALTRYSQQLWQALATTLPAGAEYQTIGTIWIAADDEEMREVARKHELYQRHDIPSKILDAAALRDAEPNLNPALAGGLLVAQDAVLNASVAASFLVQQAVERGAVLVNKKVVSIGSGSVHLSDGGVLESSRIVNAAGADASDLTPGLPIRKRKGHLAITGRNPGFVRHQLVELGYLRGAGAIAGDSVAFNVQPRKSGEILIGSSRQYDAAGNDAEPAILQRIMERGRQYMPGLDKLAVLRSWAGFRAATPDKLPLIGPYPHDPTIFLAAGHEGLGITTALATARLLTDLFTGDHSKIPAEPYLPLQPRLEAMIAKGK